MEPLKSATCSLNLDQELWYTMCHTTKHTNAHAIMETLGQIKQRHKLELRKLQSDIKEFQKRAKKERQDKKQIEAKAKEMEDEIKTRHEIELRALENLTDTKDSNIASSAEATEEVIVLSKEPLKPSRAQKRREKKERKERERRDRIEEANRNTVSERDVECDLIAQKLAPLKLQIKDIPSDGHCMYHAVADQLQQKATKDANRFDFQHLRRITSEFMLAHPDDFMPFLPLEENGSESIAGLYEEYCHRVANTSEWGGQLELRALSCALRRPIKVFSADSSVLCLGEEFDDNPLQLTYHLHYYTLGEHFNSVQPLV